MFCRDVAALLLAAASGLAACGEDGADATRGGGAPGRQTPLVLPAEPTYPDSVQGLENLMTALVKAIGEDNATERARLLLSLQLPDPRAWFEEVFGAEFAPRLLNEHERTRSGIGWLGNHIKERIGGGPVTIQAEHFDAPEQTASAGYQSAALARMVQRVPLYSVRFASTGGDESWHVWSFVHHQGTFRYVGKMRKASDREPPARGRDPLEYRMSDAARMSEPR
jgi:hypothetical protein